VSTGHETGRLYARATLFFGRRGDKRQRTIVRRSRPIISRESNGGSGSSMPRLRSARGTSDPAWLFNLQFRPGLPDRQLRGLCTWGCWC
jgi:hypothetical protein